MATRVRPDNPYRSTKKLARPETRALDSRLERILRPLASLKLTIALFAMVIFIVWAGTVAQKESGVWVAIGQYFRTWFAFVDFKVFAFFLPKPPDWSGGFYFPGGRLIGCAMAVNLLAAHGVRFKMQAKDWRLPAGMAGIAAGIGLFFLVVLVGNHLSGVQAGSPVEWPTLWFIFKLGLAGIVGAGIARLTMMDWSRRFERNLLLGGTTLLGIALVWLLVRNDFVPKPSSLRIVWQLIEGEAVGLTLLAGCMLLFKKRAGIVLIHAGIGVMMFNELFVDLTSKEPQQLAIQESHARNYTEDSRVCELAIIDSSHPEKDDVVVVPKSMLQPGKVIRDPELPFDIEVVEYYPNSSLLRLKPEDKSRANAGVGLGWAAVEEKPVSGTDTSHRIDMPAAFVNLRKKGTADSLGVYLVSTAVPMPEANPVKPRDSAAGYDMALRFKRTYKPYVVRLIKTEEHDWPGTNDPQYYSSDIHIINEGLHENRHDHIWMNNPLRFGGETFYQSGFSQDPKTGEKTSILSVVDNTGWMIPYIGCMMVVTGLGFHFVGTLLRFMRRQSTQPEQVAAPAREVPARPILLNEPLEKPDAPTWLTVGMSYVPWVAVAFCAAMALSRLIPPSAPPDAIHLSEFGALPIVHEGRLKPIDTFARTSLWTVSDRQSFEDEEGNKRPAVQWLLDMMADRRAANADKVFYLDNPELLDTLGLARIKSHYYSIDDLVSGAAKVKQREGMKVDSDTEDTKKPPDTDREMEPTTAEKYFKNLFPQLQQADAVDAEKRTPYQERLLDFGRRLMAYIELQQVFSEDRFLSFGEQEIKRQPEEAYRQTLDRIRLWDKPPKREEERTEKPKPLLVPIRSLDEVWHSYAAAKALDQVNRITGQHPSDEATTDWDAIFAAYRNGKPAEFNAAMASYRAKLDANPPNLYDSGTVNFEAFFNHFAPSDSAFGIYLLAILLALAGLLLWAFEWSAALQKTAFWLIVLALALHTFTLFARIHISGRPPVTTLYSAAVFIGWGGALLGLVLELVFKTGLGNLIAASLGAVGIGVAGLIFQFLEAGKDTIVVPEAVLDTRFWLGTHVVCVSLGYATTFVAGGLGVLYVILGIFTPLLGQKLRHGQTVGRSLAKMIYGTVCFAIFFSFFGTVLGGLWADDSWGRFWGWDPKENGALIIVVWNALVLHALWDGIVKDRGLAVLAIGGNIVTTWSMFGVNFLGVGLHSYGFSSANGWLALGAVAGCHLALVALGCLPKQLWRSNRVAVSG
jgi:ABC-type transport system involved in cytochrome c biogenesis permease subunit